MADGMRYQVELAGELATLSVSGDLGDEGGLTLLGVCDALPAHVRTLRLDLRAMGAMSATATDAVRLLIGQWRATRQGEFRLSTSHLLATCAPVAPLNAMPMPRQLPYAASDAMIAAYL